MSEIYENYEQIDININELQQQINKTDKSNPKAMALLDRKAKQIGQAINSYEIDIANHEIPEELDQLYMQLQYLQKRFDNVIQQIRNDPTLGKSLVNYGDKSYANPNQTTSFTPVKSLYQSGNGNQTNGMSYYSGQNQQQPLYKNQTNGLDRSQGLSPQQINIEMSQSNRGGIRQNQRHMHEAQQPMGDKTPNSTHRQQQMMNSQRFNRQLNQSQGVNQQFQDYQNTDNYEYQFTDENLNTYPSGQGQQQFRLKRQCAEKDCQYVAVISCYKCKNWVCEEHKFKTSRTKKQTQSMINQDIDINRIKRHQCKECGRKISTQKKNCKFLIICLFCALIIVAIFVSFMTYFDFSGKQGTTTKL